MRKVELNMKENLKYEVIKKLVETNGNKERARIKLGLKSMRQVNRLIAGYKEEGKSFFVHGNRGRKPVHTISEELKTYIEELYSDKYSDCTYTSFKEYLEERENIFLSVAEVGQILRERYLASPKSHKKTVRKLRKQITQDMDKSKSKGKLAQLQACMVLLEEGHPRQPRSKYFGEEVQIDACIHLWFGEKKATLHAAIDDATGMILGAYFEPQETLNGYYNVLYQILKNYGIPYLFKADKRTVFEYKRKGTTCDEDNTFTQFSYACKQLGIQIETSSIPQFKPRIERLFNSLQSRLIPDLRLSNITTIEEANEYLPAFIEKYNKKFALYDNNIKSVFENQPDEKEINLTLSVLSRRSIDTGHSIRFRKKYYRTVNSSGFPILFGKGTKVLVIETFDKQLFASVENAIFALEEIPEVQAYSENFDEIPEVKKRKIYIPKLVHPLKRDSFEKYMEEKELKLSKELERTA